MAVTVITKSIRSIPRLCQLLKRGEVIAAPTETAYGLLADALNYQAVRKVFKLKGRQAGKPLPLVAASLGQAARYVKITPTARKLARRYWPGPLTLVLPTRVHFPSGVATHGQVGLRVPGSVWLQRLLAAYGRPLTATSANRAGRPALYSSAAVVRDLAALGLRYAVDGGRLKPRPTSTVVRVYRGKLIVLRVGAVSVRKLKQTLPGVRIMNNES